MKKLYYRCEDIVNDVLETEAERLHITKNRLIDDIIRRHFDIMKIAKQYRKFSETEEKMLAEIIKIGSEVVEIHGMMIAVEVAEGSYDSSKVFHKLNESLLTISRRLKSIEAKIKALSQSSCEMSGSDING